MRMNDVFDVATEVCARKKKMQKISKKVFFILKCRYEKSTLHISYFIKALERIEINSILKIALFNRKYKIAPSSAQSSNILT